MRKHKTIENSWQVIARCHVNGDDIVLMLKPSLGYVLRVYHSGLMGELFRCQGHREALKRYQAASHAAIERLMDSE